MLGLRVGGDCLEVAGCLVLTAWRHLGRRRKVMLLVEPLPAPAHELVQLAVNALNRTLQFKLFDFWPLAHQSALALLLLGDGHGDGLNWSLEILV